MPRYKLIVEYDGTPYSGFQRQGNAPSVQQALEEALGKFCGREPRLSCAGRTDTGVHATHQVIHIDLEKTWKPGSVRDATNAHLKQADERISILAAEIVPDTFDARRSAIRRHYLYRILDRRPPPALDMFRVWHVPRPLDAEAMHRAAQFLVGHHDFTTFRASACQATGPMRTLERLDVMRAGEEIHIYASARSFLHHQVRSMVGSLAQVGQGYWCEEDIKTVLEARDRTRCGMVAPAWGLTFIGVDYKEVKPS